MFCINLFMLKTFFLYKNFILMILFLFQFSKEAQFVSCFNDTFVQANYRNKKVKYNLFYYFFSFIVDIVLSNHDYFFLFARYSQKQ